MPSEAIGGEVVCQTCSVWVALFRLADGRRVCLSCVMVLDPPFWEGLRSRLEAVALARATRSRPVVTRGESLTYETRRRNKRVL